MTIILIYTHDGYEVICIFTLHAINLLYVDQSTRTGFSFSSDNRDLCHNEDRVSNDLYDFLQAFFTEHPQYAKNDFYIMGESYVGHYIPAFAARVHRGNKAKEGIHINLKAYYALEMGIIQQSEYKNVNKMLPACELATKLCALLENGVKLLIYAGEYDLICNCLGNSRWVHAMECSGHKQFVGSPIVPFVVDGAKAGQMKSYGSLSFLKVSPSIHLKLRFSNSNMTTNHITNTDFYDNKQVHDAGHMVPMDQPKATLEMLERWTKGKLVENTETEDVVTDM
ncbi:hypothetical protein GIB67_019942 [Kingdonia uniflora]|uniref:Carboxypeptidase n=1 Tax=Kingdonia uniflora TaxID=39325 RepID=A0A7J7MKK4_9MAGN|nr:hypothetical protein GIB67_019942 [Kingdonia uniflora]